MSEARYATFDPENFAVGTGLLDDADVLIKSAKFAPFTYPGTATTTLALILVLEDAEGKEHEQPYSVGDLDKFAASDDGSKILLTGNATQINAKSNFAQFIKSLIDSGVPRTRFQTDNIAHIVGTRVHVNAMAQKDKEGKEAKNAKGFTRTILLATKLIALPGEKPAAGTKATGTKATTKPAASQTDAPSEEITDKVVGYVAQVAAAAGGTLPRSKVSALVFQAAMKAKDADKAVLPKLAFDPEFLTANSGRGVQVGDVYTAFEYDAATQVITAAA